MGDDLASILERRKAGGRSEMGEVLSWMRLEDRLRKEKGRGQSDESQLSSVLKSRRDKQNLTTVLPSQLKTSADLNKTTSKPLELSKTGLRDFSKSEKSDFSYKTGQGDLIKTGQSNFDKTGLGDFSKIGQSDFKKMTDVEINSQNAKHMTYNHDSNASERVGSSSIFNKTNKEMIDKSTNYADLNRLDDEKCLVTNQKSDREQQDEQVMNGETGMDQRAEINAVTMPDSSTDTGLNYHDTTKLLIERNESEKLRDDVVITEEKQDLEEKMNNEIVNSNYLIQCEAAVTCEEPVICETAVTCEELVTCEAPVTCEEPVTCEASVTCEAAVTCEELVTCEVAGTCEEPVTCKAPVTCDAPVTCEAPLTCEADVNFESAEPHSEAGLAEVNRDFSDRINRTVLVESGNTSKTADIIEIGHTVSSCDRIEEVEEEEGPVKGPLEGSMEGLVKGTMEGSVEGLGICFSEQTELRGMYGGGGGEDGGLGEGLGVEEVPDKTSSLSVKERREQSLSEELESDVFVGNYEHFKHGHVKPSLSALYDKETEQLENCSEIVESPDVPHTNFSSVGREELSGGSSRESEGSSRGSSGSGRGSGGSNRESGGSWGDCGGSPDGEGGEGMDTRRAQSFKCSSTSISDRLAQLQKSGQEDWRKRLGGSHRDLTVPSSNGGGVEQRQKNLLSVEATPLTGQGGVVRREGGARGAPRPTSIADRLSLLQNSQSTWKGRVEDKDTNQFTVEGKLNRMGVAVDSSLSNRQRRDARIRDSESSGGYSEPGSPMKPKLPVVSIAVHDETLSSSSSVKPQHDTSKDSSRMSVESISSDSSPVKVLVPCFDDLSSFFSQPKTNEKISVTVDDFDDIFLNSHDILPGTKKVKPRRANAGSRNPLKTMSMLVDIQYEYTDIKTDIAERELNRVKRERITGGTHFAQEALAGLASVENFSKVALRKADSFHGASSADQYRPYTQLMLLSIKGRRWCQTRLVEPRAKSVNSGDCYLLVTPDVIYMWVGEFSNIIERSKASDLATQIQQKHDLGVHSNCQLSVIEEEKQSVMRSAHKFWNALGESQVITAQAPGANDEDELYEVYMNEANRVYEMIGDKLCLSNEFSGKSLKYSALDPTKVLAFDFGSEFYVWTGKQVMFDKRKKAMSLAKEIFDAGYDYSDCNVNPLSPRLSEEKGGVSMSGASRPDWSLFCKVSQNMETSLFKEKFIDWPESSSKVIRVKSNDKKYESKVDLVADLKPVDARKFLTVDDSPVTLILEGSNVGRGSKWEEMIDGIKWEYEIVMQGVKVWHVTEGGCQKLDQKSYGQFHEHDSYVIRWKYAINQLTRKLKTEESRLTSTGRSRCAYFFWQGRHSSVNEKGAAALMTVELGKDKGPQIRVPQGSEPPCFINLFSGHMAVHADHRNSRSGDEARLYLVRNELQNEVYLMEVECSSRSLRSRASLVLVNPENSEIMLWHGAKSPGHVIKRAREILKNLQECCPVEFGIRNENITVSEIEEGQESSKFWSLLKSKRDRSVYGSLIHDGGMFNYSPRLYHMSSQSGSFEMTEIRNPAVNHIGLCSPFPFLQSVLYSAPQPALFMFDNDEEVYLWQGWWPVDDSDDVDNLRTGYALPRFNVDRKCAMQTCLQYCTERNPSRPLKAHVVYAGCEPISFTSLFPVWEINETVQQLAIKDGRVGGLMEGVSDVLACLTRSTYSWQELQQRPLPDGVDPLKLEAYLTDQEFNTVVGMTRSEFNALPVWQQNKAKQSARLF